MSPERVPPSQLDALVTALKNAGEAIEITDNELTFIFVNPAWERLTGYSLEEAVGKTPAQLLRSDEHPEDFYREIESGLGRGDVWRGEITSRRKDGTPIHFEMTVSPVWDARGTQTGHIAVKRDISERKRAERALRQSEERFRTLVESAADAILVNDFDGRFVDCNDYACDSLGYPRSELLGMDVSSIWYGPALPSVWSDLVPYAPVTVRGFHRRRNGSTYPVELRMSVLAAESRRLVLSIARDLSERQRSAEIRAHSQRVIQAQETERRRVARELHDGVNQILCSVKIQLDSMRGNRRGDHSVAEEDFERLEKLIDHSMSEVHRISHNLRPVVLDDLGLVAAVESMCEAMRARTGIEVRSSCESFPALPPETEANLFRLIQEALFNIERHSGARSAEVALRGSRFELEVTVRDNGEGFDLAEEGRTTPSSYSGIVNMRERAALIGGRVVMRSRPGEGTTITLQMPAPSGEPPR